MHDIQIGAVDMNASEDVVATRSGVPPRLNDLDGLRGVCAILVVGSHLSGLGPLPAHWFLLVLAYSWTTMDVFFCLSGYFIGRQVLEKIHLKRFWPIYFQRRALRIWPVYYSALLVTAAFSTLFSHISPLKNFDQRSVSWWPFLVFMQFTWLYLPPRVQALNGTQPFWHSWSVALEEQFYLLIPIYIALLLWVSRFRNTRFSQLITLLLFTSPIAGSILLRGSGLSSWLLGGRTDGFIVGILVAWVQYRSANRPALTQSIRRSVSRLLPFALVAINLFGMLEVGIFCLQGPTDFDADTRVLGITLAAMCASIVVASCVFGASPRLSRILERPPFRSLGRVSYSTYMWHFPIISFMAPLLNHDELPFLLQIGVMLFLIGSATYFSYRYIEQPMDRRKPSFRSR